MCSVQYLRPKGILSFSIESKTGCMCSVCRFYCSKFLKKQSLLLFYINHNKFFKCVGISIATLKNTVRIFTTLAETLFIRKKT